MELKDEAFYWLRFEDELIVGQYSELMREFYVPGSELTLKFKPEDILAEIPPPV